MDSSSFRSGCRWSRRLGTLVAVLLVASFDAGAQRQSAAAQGDMPAGIHVGACTDPNPEPVHRLTDVRLSGVTGDAADDDDDDVQAGQAGGIGGTNVEPVTISETEIDDRIDALTEQPHVVIIWDSANRARVLACGQIGGFPINDDDLAFGLTEQTDSGYHGIVILDEEDDNEVEVTLYLAGSGAMASVGTGSTSTSDALAGDDADAGDDLGGDDVIDDDADDAG